MFRGTVLLFRINNVLITKLQNKLKKYDLY